MTPPRSRFRVHNYKPIACANWRGSAQTLKPTVEETGYEVQENQVNHLARETTRVEGNVATCVLQ
jgi:hypothetical protein